MREKFLIVLFIAAAAVAELFPNASAQQAADKAEQILAAARAAIGGDKLKSLQSLSIEGEFRRTMGTMQTSGSFTVMESSGSFTVDMLTPDKVLRLETMNMMGGVEITRLECLNGDKVWEDQQQSGGAGMVMIRRGGRAGDPKGAEDMIRSEALKTSLGFLLSAPSSLQTSFTYAGEAESPDGKADVLRESSCRSGFAAVF